MSIIEEIRIFWENLRAGQKAVVLAVVLILIAFMLSGWFSSLRSGHEIRKFERQAAAADRDAQAALETAAKIARERLDMERRLAEKEIERDEKNKQFGNARIESIDARRDYDRALREQRGDNPSREQLCAELAALGYACQ